MIKIHREKFQNSMRGQSYDHLEVLYITYMLRTPETLFRVLKDYATRPSQMAPRGRFAPCLFPNNNPQWALSTKSTDSADSTDSAGSGDSAASGNGADSADRVDSADSANSTVSAKSVESANGAHNINSIDNAHSAGSIYNIGQGRARLEPYLVGDSRWTGLLFLPPKE